MSDKKQPKIRFKGFADDWEQRKFSGIAQRSSKQSEDASLPRVEFEDIMSGEGKLSDLYTPKKDSRKGVVFHSGDILFGKLRPYLKNYLHPDFEGVALGDFWVLYSALFDTNFVYQLIQSERFQEIANISTGTKMPRSDWKLVSETDFVVPTIKSEQKLIGCILGNLDGNIAANQHKLDELKQLKKLLMQKIFSQEWRFRGFTDPWEQRKWSETVDISTDMVDPKTGEFDNLPHIGPGNIESFSGKLLPNVRTVHDSHLISGKFHFFPGNIIYGKINPQLGKYVLPNFEGLSSADTYVLNAKNGLNQYFLFGLIQTNNFYKYSVSVSMRTGMPKINRDELDQYIFSAPSVEEQKGIGLLLLKIQNIIAANQQKLTQLKQLKKYLMQNMFV